MDNLSKNLVRVYLTILVAIIVSGLLFWQHFNGGVPSHHLLHRNDLPAISNWWGILLPVITWLFAGIVYKRESQKYPFHVRLGFLGGLIYGILLSVSFSIGLDQIASIMGPALLVISVFLPIYRFEYVLGFVIGMFYTFGTVLPTGFALIIASLSFAIYQFIRPIPLYIIGKLTSVKKA